MGIPLHTYDSIGDKSKACNFFLIERSYGSRNGIQVAPNHVFLLIYLLLVRNIVIPIYGVAFSNAILLAFGGRT